MISIVILGTGNVAKHLFKAFMAQEDLEVVQVYARNPKTLSHFGTKIKTTSDLTKIEVADIYILAVSDDAISQLSKQLNPTKGLLVHTSGNVSIKALPKGVRRGVFYPLQTLSANRNIDFKEIPICIETANAHDHELLKQLASAISDTVVPLTTKQRKTLHLAAVFANNFTNHMYHLSHEICGQNDIPFEVLLPLIMETANKLEVLSPYDAQTGPARRSDMGTIKNHLTLLKGKKQKKIYSLITKAIRSTYGEKL